MFHYCLFGYGIHCNCELALLQKCARPADIVVTILHQRHVTTSPDWIWVYHSQPPANWFSIAQRGGDFLIRFNSLDMVYLVKMEKPIQINAYIPDSIPEETLAHLTVDAILPWIIGTIDPGLFHGSAALVDRDAVGFLGKAGAGKSTLAASFNNVNNRQLADDCFHIQQSTGYYNISPPHPNARLWEDTVDFLVEDTSMIPNVAHYTSKKRVAFNDGQFDSSGQRLRHLYILQTDDSQEEISIHKLTASDAFIKLTQHYFGLSYFLTREYIVRRFDFVADLLKVIPVYSLSYSHDYNQLYRVRAAIVEHVTS